MLGTSEHRSVDRSAGSMSIILSTPIGKLDELVMVRKMIIDVFNGRVEAGPATANKVVLNEFLDGFHRLDFCIRQNYAEGKTEG